MLTPQNVLAPISRHDVLASSQQRVRGAESAYAEGVRGKADESIRSRTNDSSLIAVLTRRRTALVEPDRSDRRPVHPRRCTVHSPLPYP